MNVAYGVMITDEALFYKNFADNVLPIRTVGVFSPTSASSGLNCILNEMEDCGYELGILIHQDVELPEGWLEKVLDRIKSLPSNWLVAGVWGLKKEKEQVSYYGRIVDSRVAKMFGSDKPVVMYAGPLPQEVDALDEVCLIVKLGQGFRFSKAMNGFDLYGSYICLWAKKNGHSAWAIDAKINHNTKRSWSWEPDNVFFRNWDYMEKEFPEYNIVSTVHY